MAQISDLQESTSVATSDECLVRQGTEDRRISFTLAEAVSWGKRAGYTYSGVHAQGVVFNSYNTFTYSNGMVYFVSNRGVTLPYTSTESDPANDTSLSATKQGVFGGYLEKVVTQNMDVIDASLYSTATYTTTSAAATIGFTNLPDTTEAFVYSCSLYIKDAIGTTYTWPTGITWADDTPPTTEAGGKVLVVLAYFTESDEWIGTWSKIGA